jgi:hypothetical protein
MGSGRESILMNLNFQPLQREINQCLVYYLDLSVLGFFIAKQILGSKPSRLKNLRVESTYQNNRSALNLGLDIVHINLKVKSALYRMQILPNPMGESGV